MWPGSLQSSIRTCRGRQVARAIRRNHHSTDSSCFSRSGSGPIINRDPGVPCRARGEYGFGRRRRIRAWVEAEEKSARERRRLMQVGGTLSSSVRWHSSGEVCSLAPQPRRPRRQRVHHCSVAQVACSPSLRAVWGTQARPVAVYFGQSTLAEVRRREFGCRGGPQGRPAQTGLSEGSGSVLLVPKSDCFVRFSGTRDSTRSPSSFQPRAERARRSILARLPGL